MAERWWQFRGYQPGTMSAIAAIPRYIGISRVTKRPILEFIDSGVYPDNALGHSIQDRRQIRFPGSLFMISDDRLLSIRQLEEGLLEKSG
jgi:hypothetical protein